MKLPARQAPPIPWARPAIDEAEMREVGALIVRVLENISSEAVLSAVRSRVSELAARFPLYVWRRAPAADRVLSSVRA